MKIAFIFSLDSNSFLFVVSAKGDYKLYFIVQTYCKRIKLILNRAQSFMVSQKYCTAPTNTDDYLTACLALYFASRYYGMKLYKM